jgi:GNAT superfamily N-acetyltransferase
VSLEVRPLTGESFPNLESLLGKGAFGCWCMWWRMPPALFNETSARQRRDALQSMVAAGHPTGLLAYRDGVPVGWVSVSPRSDLPRLEESRRTFKPVDGRAPWAVSCFFIKPSARRQGVARALLRAAVVYAREQGADLLEAYPRDGEPASDGATFRGTLALFQAEGFSEVARRLPRSPIVRLELRA